MVPYKSYNLYGSALQDEWPCHISEMVGASENRSFSMEINAYKSGLILLAYICIIVGDPLS